MTFNFSIIRRLNPKTNRFFSSSTLTFIVQISYASPNFPKSALRSTHLVCSSTVFSHENTSTDKAAPKFTSFQNHSALSKVATPRTNRSTMVLLSISITQFLLQLFPLMPKLHASSSNSPRFWSNRLFQSLLRSLLAYSKIRPSNSGSAHQLSAPTGFDWLMVNDSRLPVLFVVF